MNASSLRSASSSSRCRAPAVLAVKMAARSARSVSPMPLDWPMPAAWTTAVSSPAGMSSSTAARASRSATSHATTVTRVPAAARASRCSRAPGASTPRRLARTRCSAPWAASQPAIWLPTPPVPPVMRIVPGRAPVQAVANPAARGASGARRRPMSGSRPGPRRRRRPRGRPVRDGPAGGAGVQAGGQVDQAAPALRVLQGRDPAESPQGRLDGAERGGSEGPTETAPRVAHHSGAVILRSSSACRSATVAARAAGIAGWPGCGPS